MARQFGHNIPLKINSNNNQNLLAPAVVRSIQCLLCRVCGQSTILQSWRLFYECCACVCVLKRIAIVLL
ncbi:hypothetical protein BLOT_008862 [Blomia tropicalis]|nr:hypothetical protein BLOT_008862 [Blomia tropicalis]